MNFLSISDFSHAQIASVFRLVDRFKAGHALHTLGRKTCIAFFPESSVRTRISFEKAVKNLGGDFILFPSTTLDKREDHKDLVGYIQNWADLCVIRHRDFSVLKRMGESSSVPIINAMTSSNHPCEILSDLYAINSQKGSYSDLVYVFVGAPGNILFSWIEAARYLGFRIHHVSPEKYRLADDSEHYSFHADIHEIIAAADVILTDPLPAELRNEAYYQKYQITQKLMSQAKSRALLNPCPPFQRGEEVSADAIDSASFVGYAFKRDLLHVQAAILHHCMENGWKAQTE
ncbi:MAG: hypothetical protein A2087_04590 [Spirochaetes bacterium GWD1_61_31]|nr:MAG: hypothetical protein A2Y37_09285 [Spirochaetes bacterium GWB1_60_80]OHD31612.1 MAG: hypothetical protein A2004_09500 [Spirochaetes bacterium GWC1_61_12]OHD40541.1 MAG: hypothetical protein A2087_04590 [Spirochaetes bacterium GWD1_61_31]OHD44042.1 MAG: hypothetical protein A2Y35_01765 [Spirochaetes bacterium GWE1_60_18]OHD59077.1 MAG: hypothetical protein A2Y32_02485 [Spirochaetes bacterium GWF1_60_12]HAP44560.1 ornithine carbamoyltransferase [Spirochaetaceae bacterium]